MEVHCLRHGVTVGNVQGRYQGFCDSALTEEQLAAFSAVRFDSSIYDAVYCSPRGRCRDTAGALGIKSLIDELRLAERHFGVFEGLPRAECERRFSVEFAAFQRFDADYEIPEGESRASNLARVLDWLEEVAVYRRVLAITHGGTIDFLYRLATNKNERRASTPRLLAPGDSRVCAIGVSLSANAQSQEYTYRQTGSGEPVVVFEVREEYAASELGGRA